MKNISQEVLPNPLIKSSGVYQNAKDNRFGKTVRGGITWYGCRDRFHENFNRVSNDKGFFYGTTDITSAARMCQFVENLLGLKDTSRSTFYRCKGGEYIFVKLSKFWLSQRMRTAFATVVIRAGCVGGSYKQRGFKREAGSLAKLMATSYCIYTPRATAMFLDGYTLYGFSRDSGKWVNSLLNPVNPQGVKSLVRPTKKKDVKYFKGDKVASRLTTPQKKQLMAWVNEKESSRYSVTRYSDPKVHIPITLEQIETDTAFNYIKVTPQPITTGTPSITTGTPFNHAG